MNFVTFLESHMTVAHICDFLAHKKVKAFISHGGMSGVYESIYAGKPMILTPVFFDQPSNAALLQELGVGICLDLQFVTKDIILDAINTVINDSRLEQFDVLILFSFADLIAWKEFVLLFLVTTAIAINQYCSFYYLQCSAFQLN